MSSYEVDKIVQQTMEKFNVPGIAVGIIKDGNVIHAKGYGVREVGKKGKVNEKTLFSIASTGKSFTTVSLALLVDEGKINWDDKVIDHLPDFRLYDPWVTREFTIRDLLIHNSGLGFGAGDLMLFPKQSFSKKEIVSNLRHLKPVSSFRTEFSYSNMLYITAGEVIAAVTGKSFEDFVENRILKPLNMKNCAANLIPLKGYKNVAQPHMVVNGVIKTIERDIKLGEVNPISAAGGMQCSVKSILKWHDMHLNHGLLSNGEVFLSKEQHNYIMSPHTIMPSRFINKEMHNTNFIAYCLGWVLTDMYGYKVYEHSGGLPGMLSDNLMVPELGLGIVVYTNQQADVARPVILNQILDFYMSQEKRDWIAEGFELIEKRNALEVDIPDVDNQSYVPFGPINSYAGIYRDPWFGDVTITEKAGDLYFKSIRSERLVGKLIPYKADLFIARWDDRCLCADAYVKFAKDYSGTPEAITMQAVSPLTDFSYDFPDLHFNRVNKE